LTLARDVKGGRSQAEERFDRARKTNEEARSIIDVEHDAMRKKTARLRALRLAKEAEEAAAPPVAKKAPAKKPAAKKPRKAAAKKAK
jgi:hypothetical protein